MLRIQPTPCQVRTPIAANTTIGSQLRNALMRGMDGKPTCDSPCRDQDWSAAQWEAFLEGRFDFPIRVIYGKSRSAPVQAPVSYTHLTLPTNREV